MHSIISRLDRLASILESRGMFDEAKGIDVVSNTIEANLKGFFQGLLRKIPRPKNIAENKALGAVKRIIMGPDAPEEKEDRLVRLYADMYGDEPDPAQLKPLMDQVSQASSTLFGGLGGPMESGPMEREAFQVPTNVKNFLLYLIALMKTMPRDG